MEETIVWFPGYQRPSLRDGHILAKIRHGAIASGVYILGRFVYDLIDLPSRDWSEVELWCYFPKGEST